MKKTTSLIEKLAEYQLDIDSAKNIKGGILFQIDEDMMGTNGSGYAPPMPPA